ncbi:RibD family protein [Henriciella litoralis]|uniref:RibD family protein n=1 Tax=Henriciella litoralis TaxID=568102 RepID=UPI000A026746|nr:RibD family protein [Henriciella litoralis]
MTSNVGVTLKIATSLDGRIALSNGTSQWITNSASRARVHEMRANHSAVLVGIGTVLADDPLLTARTVPPPQNQPVRIVADSRLRTPKHARLLASAASGRVVLAHAQNASGETFDGSDVDLWEVGDGSGRVSPQHLLRRCRAEGINDVFLEGGGILAASFLRAGLVSRIAWFRAPIIIGGDGISAIGALGFQSMDAVSSWRLESREQIDSDTLEIWTPDVS